MTKRDVSDMISAFALAFFLTLVILLVVDIQTASQPECPDGSVIIQGHCVVTVQPQ